MKIFLLHQSITNSDCITFVCSAMSLQDDGMMKSTTVAKQLCTTSLYIPSLIFFLGISGHIFVIRVATAILSLKQLKVILPSSSCMNWKLSPFTKEELGGGSFNTVYMCICTLHIQTLASQCQGSISFTDLGFSIKNQIFIHMPGTYTMVTCTRFISTQQKTQISKVKARSYIST